MGIGKRIRLNRLFSHPSGRLCSVAVDHFIGYGEGIPDGLRRVRRTLAALVEGAPDAVTMHRGIVTSAWEPYAGRVPWILQSTIGRVDDSACERFAEPEDAVLLGADAIAVAVFVRGSTEGQHLRMVVDCVRAAARFDLPVITHIYPRVFRDGPRVSFAPEDIAWAVRCALECGTDVIKVPYCNDVKAYAEIVAECTVPVVAAGGPKTDTLAAALKMFADVVAAGARGVTVGRNVWGHERVADVVRAVKMVVHDGRSAAEAMAAAGLR
ncbi:MAG TPA: aldolase [Phycisphaerae bacterium]|nr:aldolase [Phycisphaerae bacterium]HRY70406.1 aldolase [Phycisphaerae bacterium]HSA28123.1 aldolase [Phycisphaerae bacterium]